MPPAPRQASTARRVEAGVGLSARRIARDIVWAVLNKQRTLSDELDTEAGHPILKSLSTRDRALVHMIALTSFRRHGQITDVIGRIFEKGLPERAGRLKETIITALAQLLFMDVPAHAAVDLALRLVKEDRRARHYASLANAGLRRIARDGPAMVAGQDEAKLNTPRQLWAGWMVAYDADTTRAIALAHLCEPALDLSVTGDAAHWAQILGASILPTGSLRLVPKGRIEALAGFDDGAWWVQDTAASLPARLFGDVRGKHVIDLCAAPGGKTAQLAGAGAQVTAVDKSSHRAARLKANLHRLGLDCRIVIADALDWQPDEPADMVLLDAPCSASGILRRHPDVAWVKSTADRANLVAIQAQLLAHAATLIRPGGLLVYCTCSLEPVEGEAQIAAFLQQCDHFARVPIEAEEIGGLAKAINDAGDLRTLPSFFSDVAPPGMDGFFAARLRRGS